MITKQLIGYIKEALSKGTPEKEIEEKLTKQGWSRQEIKDTLEVIKVEESSKKKLGFRFGEKWVTYALDTKVLKWVAVVLVGLLVIMGIFYYLLTMEANVIDQCEFSGAMNCVDVAKMRSSDDVLVIYLKNTAQTTLEIQDTIKGTGSCKSPRLQSVNFRETFPLSIEDGKNMVLLIQCANIDPGYFKSSITLYYKDNTGALQKITGKVMGSAS
ncbi:hypothetical protein HZB01_05425 [Candidatus Woesearchaeota archaeon]|nr:hypothetical protein [Candidatus Woesearchaeota archaeon]